jgi:hypothetical protein
LDVVRPPAWVFQSQPAMNSLVIIPLFWLLRAETGGERADVLETGLRHRFRRWSS